MQNFRMKLLLFILLLSPAALCVAVEAPPIIAPGEQITTEQASHYSLFRDLPRFYGAWFEKVADADYLLLIVSSEDETQLMEYTYRIPLPLIPTLNQTLAPDTIGTTESGIQSPSAVLLTFDGSKIHGRVVRWTGTAIEFQTEYGLIEVPLNNILSYDERVRKQEDVSSRFGRYTDPNRNRLLFMPTGRSLERGEGYISIYEVVMPSATVGVGSNISIGGGIFPFIGTDFFLGWGTLQAGLIEQQNYAVGIGALGFGATGGDEATSFGIVYSSGSYGSADRSITGGLGYGFADGELASRPFISFGGHLRTGRSIALITENWLLPNVDAPLVSIGIRWFGDRFAADFAIVRPTWVPLPILGIPWFGLVYNF